MTAEELHMEWCPNGDDCIDPKCTFWANILDVVKFEREKRIEPLLAVLQAHFNRLGAESDPELAEAFAQYCGNL